MGDQSSISARKQKAGKQARTEAATLKTAKIQKSAVRKGGKTGPGAARKK